MTSPTVNLLLASDLHLDSGHYDLAGQITRLEDAGRRVDAVVLAGDIVEVAGGDPVAYAAIQVPAYIPAIFVPGNHDFYGGRYGNLLNRWRARARGSHVHVLAEDTLTVTNGQDGEIVVVGTPLWSNLESLGPLVEADLRRGLPRWIADFSCMHASDGRAWTVTQMLERFERAKAFLEGELADTALADGRRRVVVSHFGPHRGSMAARWRDEAITAYFVNHLPELVTRADLWLHGHTHDGFDYQVGSDPCRGRVICHPRGYAGGMEKAQALAYVPRLIDVPVARAAWARAPSEKHSN
jgi:predicted phosphodiesterase